MKLVAFLLTEVFEQLVYIGVLSLQTQMTDSDEIVRRKRILALAVVTSDQLLQTVMSDSSNSESDEELDLTACSVKNLI